MATALRALGGEDDPVAKGFERLLRDLAHGGFVIHDEDQFVLAARQFGGNVRGPFGGRLGLRGKVDFERRALSRFAVCSDESTVALHDGQRGREPEAGALADFLGGEKGIEDFLDDSRRNAGPSVLDLDKNVRSQFCLWVQAGVMRVEAEVLGGDDQLAAIRHGIARVHTEIEQQRARRQTARRGAARSFESLRVAGVLVPASYAALFQARSSRAATPTLSCKTESRLPMSGSAGPVAAIPARSTA